MLETAHRPAVKELAAALEQLAILPKLSQGPWPSLTQPELWPRFGVDAASLDPKLAKPRQGVVFTPPHIAHFLAWQLGAPAGAEPLVVYDPAAGTGSLLAAYGARFGWQRCQLVADEIQHQLLEYARQLLAPHAQLEARCRDTLMSPLKNAWADVVIANPPFLPEKGNRALFQSLATQSRWRGLIQARGDLLYLFLHHILDVLKPGGRFGIITTAYWPSADSAKVLRADLAARANLLTFIDLGGLQAFSRAKGQHNLIIIGQRKPMGSPSAQAQVFKLMPKGSFRDLVAAFSPKPNKSKGLSFNSFIPPRPNSSPWQLFISNDDRELLEAIDAMGRPLSEFLIDRQGIVSGADRDKSGGRGIFLVHREEVGDFFNLGRKSGWLRGLVRGSTIRPFSSAYAAEDLFMVYLRGDEDPEKNNLQAALEWLKPYRDRLEARREVQQGRRPWWALQWPRDHQSLTGPKLVCPRRSPQAVFGLEHGHALVSSDCTYLCLKSPFPNGLRGAAWVLNSSLVDFQLQRRGKRKGELIELYSSPLRKLRLPSSPSLAHLDLDAPSLSPLDKDIAVIETMALPTKFRKRLKKYAQGRW